MALTTLPTKNDQLADIFDHLGAALDIPPDLYALAVERYTEVGRHLARPQSRLAPYVPVIFPQGSLRLGTIVAPVVPGCEYDVDLVCQVAMVKTSVTQKELKDMVGQELRLGWPKELKERRRCWTLAFAAKFHLDVLPAIPDLTLPPTGILLTDRELRLWQHSDPKAYAKWFEARMAAVFAEFKRRLALELRANVADVPDWRVRTPLQRVVQILKRHRDVYFANELDRRPASIIVTTLSAQLYRGQTSIADALLDVIAALPKIPRRSDGYFEILNPVNPKENFADKWNEDPELSKAFFRWVGVLQEDMRAWTDTGGGLHRLTPALTIRFGEGVVKKALTRYGESFRTARDAGALAMATGGGNLIRSTAGPGLTSVPPHTFFGER
jgi:hypothetical protein